MFIRFDRIQEREIPRQMDRHRMHDVAGRACIASRGKPEAKKLRQIYESDVKNYTSEKGGRTPRTRAMDSPCNDTVTYVLPEAQLLQRGRATLRVIENLAVTQNRSRPFC